MAQYSVVGWAVDSADYSAVRSDESAQGETVSVRIDGTMKIAKRSPSMKNSSTMIDSKEFDEKIGLTKTGLTISTASLAALEPFEPTSSNLISNSTNSLRSRTLMNLRNSMIWTGYPSRTF